MTQLIVPKAPNLPLSPATYDRTYADQVNNALRLYFNRIDSTLQSITTRAGVSNLNSPYAAIQRTTNNTFTVNTATQITFDQNDFLNGCTNDGTDGIAVSYSGIYNYQFSVQWKNTDSQEHTAWIWLRVNGVDVAGTGSQFSIIAKHGSTDGHVIAAANFYVELNANDTVEMWAAVDNTAVSMEAYAARTSPFAMPAIPSVVATLSFVSSLPT